MKKCDEVFIVPEYKIPGLYKWECVNCQATGNPKVLDSAEKYDALVAEIKDHKEGSQ